MTSACTGRIGDRGSPTPGGPPGGPDALQGIGRSGVRRLTRDEYDNTVRDLLGDTTRPSAMGLPDDVADPFDNDFHTQQVSSALIEGAETLAEMVAARAPVDPATRARVVGCTPTGPGDADCMQSFIRAFGRRALRRVLSDAEVEQLRTLSSYAMEDNDFYTGARLVIETLLQHPEFLYRVEIGTPVPNRPGVYRLSSWEMATRLSYFLWGTAPDDALLDAAAADQLRTPDQLRAQATRMLGQSLARSRVDRFHALWLGYERLAHSPELNTALRRESDALVERVVFERHGSWLDLFGSTETFADPTLAMHYGLAPPPGPGPAWISYGTSGRRGILSHGSFLSVAARFGDTSPTQRGILVRTRLLCQNVPPPPPNVNVDQPPMATMSLCKADRYAAHSQGGCAGCHGQLDPIGFGLENYDSAGAYRTTDNGQPTCTIAGTGRLAGVGTEMFRGPAELGDLLVNSGMMDRCLVTQVYRFAVGHREAGDDAPLIADLQARFRTNQYRFDQLLIDLVSADAFGYRMDE